MKVSELKTYRGLFKVNRPQQESIERMKPMIRGAHFINIQIRINGEFKTFEADFLRDLFRTLEAAP